MTNYFAPAFSVEINGTRLNADVSRNIQQVQIVSKPDTLDTFSMTVVNALPEMRWTHSKTDSELFRESHSVKIKMGYVDDLQEMIEGDILGIKATFPEGGTPTLLIEGHSLLYRLQRCNKTRTFQKGVTDKEIVETIAKDSLLDSAVEDTHIHYDYVMQPNQTDLTFLRDRAKRIDFEILIKNKTLIFRKAKEAESKKYTLFWAHQQRSLGGNPLALPLKSFSPELNIMEAVSAVEHRAYDVLNKKALVSRAGASDQTSKMKGSQTGADVLSSRFNSECVSLEVASPYSSQAEGDQRTKADYNDKAKNLIKGSAETIGVPDLRAGQVVEMQGLGERFNGDYYIEELTHSLSTSGYRTSFKVRRNTTSS